MSSHLGKLYRNVATGQIFTDYEAARRDQARTQGRIDEIKPLRVRRRDNNKYHSDGTLREKNTSDQQKKTT